MIKFNAEKLTLILAKRGMLYRDLSRLTGISENALRAIRRGEAQPRLNTIYKISAVLGIEVEDLVELENKQVGDVD